MIKKNVFSAIQPTGNLTIGHYIGVLSNWLKMQYKYNCFFCIADLHSLTNLNSNKNLKNNIFDILSIILSIGIDPQKCTIFLQSSISEHMKLYWFLNCYTYIGELNRMTQFKEKKKKYKKINCGLMNYPILMCSDILLYKSDYVPIGFDQIQHLELTRNIAKRINNFYSFNIFNLPNYVLHKNKFKIMSLLDPLKKMSKSDLNINNIIFLLDNINIIKEKINNAVTDSDNPSKIFFDIKNKPGISNLLNIVSSIKNVSIKKLQKEFVFFSYKDFKKFIINEIILFVENIQKKYFFFRKKEFLLKKILLNGYFKAKKCAKKNISNIYNLINLNII